jgi:general secretion pathway protein D
VTTGGYRGILTCARALAAVSVLALAGCTGGPSAHLDSPQQIDLRAKKPNAVSRRDGAALSSNGAGGQQFFPGSENGLADNQLEPPPGVSETEGKFSINLDRADINEASRLVLGETLGLNYIVDPRVQGTITLSSSRPLAAREVLDAFEAALRHNGAALIQADGLAKVVALQEVLEGEPGIADLDPSSNSPGYGVTAVPLRYISGANMMELMDSFVARGGSVRASKSGNLVLVRGSAAERKTMVDIILSFDVDWMENQSASVATLSNATPEEMVSKLQAVFADDAESAGKNALKVIPLERLNGVVIIANSASKVKRAMTWVRRLDKGSVTDVNYYVYAVQNGNALDLANILKSTFLDQDTTAGRTAEVAPNLPTVQFGTNQQSGDTGAAQQQQVDQNGQPIKSDREDATIGASPETTASTSPTDNQNQQESPTGIRITPNVTNNTIVIRANQRDYRKILATLRKIDAPSVQVLINTTIMEVALNDNLQYGVQAYLQGNNIGGGVTNNNSSLTIRPSFPGLNFFVGKAADPKLVIDALSAVTNVRIVSSPSVLVLENETATIKVGDQVPIKTQQVQSTTNIDTVTNSFEYRDTGVILTVKPRVTAAGVVTIELGQQLSAVTPSAGSSGSEQENPTFSQRSITSKVSVPSTQTVLLGGLMSGSENLEKDSVPGVNKVPILGDLIGSTSKRARRNELVVFITPRIIENGEDASNASQELRAKMKSLGWN